MLLKCFSVSLDATCGDNERKENVGLLHLIGTLAETIWITPVKNWFQITFSYDLLCVPCK